MKRIILAIALAASATPALSAEYVQGYFRSNGTYVAPYFRSAPNSTTLDNYSYGVNPYINTRPSYAPPPVKYYIPKPYYGGSAYPYSRQ